MGTTTKMAIPYPEATGLVKDGWEDMKDIATQVDAKTGLVLINTFSFSAVSSQSFSDVFSSSFTNYLAVLDFKGSASNFATIRLRTSTDDTGSVYYWQRLIATSTTVSGSSQSAQTSFDIGYHLDNTSGKIINFYRPNVADKTAFDSRMGVWTYIAQYAGLLDTTTQYTGFTLIPSAGTVTGQAKIYGYN